MPGVIILSHMYYHVLLFCVCNARLFWLVSCRDSAGKPQMPSIIAWESSTTVRKTDWNMNEVMCLFLLKTSSHWKVSLLEIMESWRDFGVARIYTIHLREDDRHRLDSWGFIFQAPGFPKFPTANMRCKWCMIFLQNDSSNHRTPRDSAHPPCRIVAKQHTFGSLGLRSLSLLKQWGEHDA